MNVVDVTTALETRAAFLVQVGDWDAHLVTWSVSQEVHSQWHIRHDIELHITHDGLDRSAVSDLDVEDLVFHRRPKLAVHLLENARLQCDEHLLAVAVRVLAVDDTREEALFPQATSRTGAFRWPQLKLEHIEAILRGGGRRGDGEERRARRHKGEAAVRSSQHGSRSARRSLCAALPTPPTTDDVVDKSPRRSGFTGPHVYHPTRGCNRFKRL